MHQSNFVVPKMFREQSVGDLVITFPDAVNCRTDFDTLNRLLMATGLDSGDKQCLTDLKY